MNPAKETARVEAFSDGVFAIAITLLVLDLKAPPESASLLAGLLAQWPVYVAYLISFLFILIMWVNHHRMFEHIARVDNNFLYLNGFGTRGLDEDYLTAAHLARGRPSISHNAPFSTFNRRTGWIPAMPGSTTRWGRRS